MIRFDRSEPTCGQRMVSHQKTHLDVTVERRQYGRGRETHGQAQLVTLPLGPSRDSETCRRRGEGKMPDDLDSVARVRPASSHGERSTASVSQMGQEHPGTGSFGSSVPCSRAWTSSPSISWVDAALLMVLAGQLKERPNCRH